MTGGEQRPKPAAGEGATEGRAFGAGIPGIRSRWLAVLICLLLLAGTAPGLADEHDAFADDPFAGYEAQAADDNDPLEIPNRFVFAFNQALDFAVIRPIAYIYKTFVPEYGRDRIRNVLRNLKAPLVLANDLLQGNWERADATANRFIINTTAGGLGLFDVADELGYPYHDEDFGQTLGVHGVGEGPYLMLPLLGPSNLRDATGRVADIFLDPLTYLAYAYDRDEWLIYPGLMTGLDFRARNMESLDDIQRDSIDFYARLRSLYRQHRAAEIRNDLGSVEGFSSAREHTWVTQASLRK
ncbi:MAG: VacJ family lipoprotein [Dehalococcoidia bacterium]